MKKTSVILYLSLIAIFTVLNFQNFTSMNDGDLKIKALMAFAQDSNENGSGMYFYPTKDGNPQFCKIYMKIGASGNVVATSESEFQAEAGFTYDSRDGLKERCPRSGGGCTVYSCHVTNNTNP